MHHGAYTRLITTPCNDYLLFRAATPMSLAVCGLGRFNIPRNSCNPSDEKASGLSSLGVVSPTCYSLSSMYLSQPPDHASFYLARDKGYCRAR
ncbi:hypothetical protein BS47DRAFT_1350390, partial [Hydnum rufescens UP504]